MKKPVCSMMILLLASAVSWRPNIANAQLHPGNPQVHSANLQAPTTQPNGRAPYRYTGGWQVSTPQNQSSPAAAGPPAVVQAAFYQAPNSGRGFPAIPGGEANNANSMPQIPGGMPNALTGSGLMVGRQNDYAMPNNTPPHSYLPDHQPVSPPSMPSQFDPYARQQQVLPPSQLPSPFRPASTDLRAVQNAGLQNPEQANPAQDNQGNDLRPVRPTMQRGFGPNTRTIEVASGYPFVSPAPGNYPTSQYSGSVFRPIAYQNVVQSPQAPLSAAVANTQPTLPQFQNAPGSGIFPAQYQCTPGAPIYPPTGAVPGNYVPPTLTPNLAPGMYSPNNSGYTPFFSLGQENYNVQIGRGIIGQPTVYVPGQPVRNFLRYLSP